MGGSFKLDNGAAKASVQKKGLLTIVLAMLLAVSLCIPTQAAYANPLEDAGNAIASFFGLGDTRAAGDSEKFADASTANAHEGLLGDEDSTQYAGRVWTDKTVFSGDATFEGDTGSPTVVNDSDFLVSYSALSTSTSVMGQTQAPIDVVFVIDLSGSMSNQNSNMDNGKSRIANTVDAVNASIEKLMELNEHTRIAVVGYSSTATTLLPLDHYSKRNNNSYLSLDRNEGSDWWSTTLTYQAVGSSGNQVNSTISVSGGTNTQVGMYQGMNLLANASSTTVDINGTTVSRIPSVILLSDGASTYSSNSGSWWAPDNNNSHGPGGSSYAGNGMKLMMTASYMKQAIDAHYNVTEDAYKTTVYTIGMGITSLNGDDRYLAEVSLNPTAHLSANNSMSNEIREAWNTYKDKGRPSVMVDEEEDWFGSTTPVYYTFNHPSSNDITSIEYVNKYYDANNADQVTNVYDDIVSNISVSRPSAPTKVEGGDYDGDGYITYTDPIGEYMEVKDFKEIICGGQRFTSKMTTQIQGGTRYVFEGSLTNDVYGKQELSNIYVDVLTDASGNQTVKIDIPAASIPLRINTVTLNNDGTVESNTNNGAEPIRFLYTVGFRADVLTDGKVDLDKVSEDYKLANKSEDGTSVNFYSNKYTGTTMYSDQTAGDAYVEYTPATNNPFYYIQNNIPLTNAETGQPTTGDFDMNAKYKFSLEYYDGTEKKTVEYTRQGSELAQEVGGNLEGVTKNSDGVWCVAAGTPRLANLSQFNVAKTDSPTQSADLAHYPTFVGQSVETGHFKTYLGNNGLLSVELPGSLSVSKTVEVDSGSGLAINTEKDFTFTLDLTGGESGAQYPAQKYNADDAAVGEAFTISDGGTFTLKHGETLKVTGLSGGMTYSVAEAAEKGYTTSVTPEGAESGTIVAGGESAVAYVNKYEVSSASLGGSTYLKYQKQLKMEDGTDAWGQNFGIEFEFRLMAASYTGSANIKPTEDSFPMPGEATGTTEAGNKYHAQTVKDGDVANFGDITFDKPGEYIYLIYEKTPAQADQAVGVSYSGMVYRVIVTVEDNGDGTLSVSSVMKRTYDQGGQPIQGENWETITDNTAVILNEFDLASTYVGPTGTKVYTDASDGGNPLVANMFTFKIKPLTEGAPVPLGAEDKPLETDPNDGAYVTKNAADGSIAFGRAKFEEQHVNNTYVYEIWEDVPAGATDGVLNGMTYDQNHYYVHVAVSKKAATDGGADAVVATMTYRTGPNATDPEIQDVTFNNTYDPEDAVADISVSKVVSGRYWLENESFTFNLTAVDGAPLPKKDGEVSTEVTLDTATPATAPGVAVMDTFGTVTFDKTGVYTYTVKEAKGGTTSNGLAYDGTTSTITITVTDDKAGKLSASVAYSNDYNNEDSASTFHNVYTASTTMAGVDVSKVLNGRGMDEGEFTFTIRGVDNPAGAQDASYVSAEDAEKKVSLTDANRTFKNTRAASGVPAVMNTPLNEIKFTQADAGKTFVYRVDEVTDSADRKLGVTYDENSYLVTIAVADKGDGTMSTTTKVVRESDGTEVATSNDSTKKVTVPFVNSYAPTSLEFDTADIEFNKLVTGRDWLDDPAESFEFSIAATNVTNAPGMTVENMPTPESETATISNTDGSKVDGTQYAVSGFGKITFKQPGIYTYTITESMPAGATDGVLNGMTYDQDSCVVQIRVTDNLDGTMSAAVVSVLNSDFTNVYATDASFDKAFNFAVTKQLNGHAMTENQFEFKMEAIDGPVATDAKAAETAAKLGLAGGSTSKTFNGPAAETADGAVATVLSGLGEDMEFTQADSGKTFSIELKELGEDGSGYTLDKATYRMDITPSDNEATGAMTLAVKVTKSVPDKADVVNEYVWTEGSAPVGVTLPFENNYATSGTLDGSTALKVSKKLIGRGWTDGETFGFQIEKVSYKENDQATEKTDDATLAAMPAPDVLTIEVGKDGGSFGNITFTQPGIYTYKVSEVVPAESEPGMSYSPVTYTVTVKATDEAGNGTLKLETSYSPELVDGAMNFINSYQEKTVSGASGTGGAAQVGDELTYTIKYANTEASAANVVVTDMVPTGTTFVSASEGGSYDSATNTVTWTFNNVASGASGEATMTVKVSEDAVVENIENSALIKIGDHDPSQTTKVITPLGKPGSLTVSKTVDAGENGVIDTNKAFTFTVALKDAKNNALTGEYAFEGSGSVTGAANGKVKLDSEGKAQFTLTHGQQVAFTGLPSGATYGVVETPADGYTTTSANDKGTISAEAPAKASFTNTYSSKVTGDAITADNLFTEVFTGRDWADNESFTFKIEAAGGTPMPEKTEVTINGENAVKNLDGNDELDFGFGAIEFTFDDIKYATPDENGKRTKTFTYDIYEVIPADQDKLKNVTYDEHHSTLTITIIDDGKGNLSQKTDDDASGSALKMAKRAENNVFTNRYETSLDYEKVSGGFWINKHLIDRAIYQGQFEFTVTPIDGEGTTAQEAATLSGIDVKGVTGGDYTSRASSHEPEVIDGEEVYVSGAGRLNLIDRPLTQDDAGKTYKWTISEVKPKDAEGSHFQYDVKNLGTVTASIEVKDDGQGVLTAIAKVVDENGNVIGELTVDSNSDQIVEGQEAPHVQVNFTNKYEYQPVVLNDEAGTKIVATKTLTNRDPATGEFTFKVTDKKGNQVTTGTNAADGTIDFGEITYTTEKLDDDVTTGLATVQQEQNGTYVYTYQYTVSEDISNLGGGVKPIVDSFDITVTVTDDPDSNMTVVVGYPSDANSLTFENSYNEKEKAWVSMSGTKVYVTPGAGYQAPDITGKYSFTLKGSDGAPMPTGTAVGDTVTVQNDGTGSVNFGVIEYTVSNVFGTEGNAGDAGDAGDAQANGEERSKTFTYTITETGQVPGVDNDRETTKTVTVTVTDDLDGNLTVSGASEGAKFTFTNEYSVDPKDSSLTGDGGFTIKKNLTGRDLPLQADEFSFLFSARGDAPLPGGVSSITVKNAAGGTVQIPSITFTEPGSYEYDLTEIPNTGVQDGITYDTTAYKAVAVVEENLVDGTQNGDGTLNVTWVVYKGTEDLEGTEIAFNNTYSIVNPANLTLGAVKTLEGGVLEDGQFTFQLLDENGDVAAEAKNDAAGQVSFPLTFDTKGTYRFAVVEVNDGQEGVTYDNAEFKIEVTVTDDNKGSLIATANEVDGVPTFLNTYTAPEEPAKPGDPEPPALPDTSDNLGPLVIGLGALAVIACAGLVIGAVKMRRKPGAHRSK